MRSVPRDPNTPDHGAVHSASRVGQHGGMRQATTREQGPAMQDETNKTETTTANPALGRSTVAKLPPELREAVDKAIADGATIDEITARIREGGESCSRSAVGRYAKDTRELIQKRQEADRVVKAWMQEFGDRPQGELTLVLIENLRAMAIETMRHLAKREEPASSEDIARLSLALKRIESTEELRLQREQAAEKAAEAAKPKPRKGLSPETVALIRSKVEGIPYRPGDPIPSNPDESQLSPEKLAEMYPEIAPRLYRTSPQSILSLGPEPPAPEGSRARHRESRPSTSRSCGEDKERGCPQQVRA